MRKIITESWDEVEVPDNLCEIELEYEDLDIPVEEEYVEYTNTNGPMNDYGDTGEVDGVMYGTIHNWKYIVDPTDSDFEDYLKIGPNEITQDMLNDIDYDSFRDFLFDRYRDDAIADAEENHGSDDVDWEHPDDYQEEALDESKKKKKDCDSVTYTTGDIQMNIDHFNKCAGTDNCNPSTIEAGGGNMDAGGTVSPSGDNAGMGEAMKQPKKFILDEATKREIKRYYVRPQNIFCSNKADILRVLAELDGDDCSIYSLKNLSDHDDVHKLTNDDIIYYYDDRVLYDKNHVQVIDYDLFVKHEEERKALDPDKVSDTEFVKNYDDRMTDLTNDSDDIKVVEDLDGKQLNESSLTLDQKQFEDGYYIECRWDKYAGYEVLAGYEIDGTVHDDYHRSYSTKEAALKAYARLCKEYGDNELTEGVEDVELKPIEDLTMLDEWAKEDVKNGGPMSLNDFSKACEKLGFAASENDYNKYIDYYYDWADVSDMESNDFDEAFDQKFYSRNVYGELTEDIDGKVCCICGEPIEGYGNNAEPYKSGRCCDACNLKFVIPARLEAADQEPEEDKE